MQYLTESQVKVLHNAGMLENDYSIIPQKKGYVLYNNPAFLNEGILFYISEDYYSGCLMEGISDQDGIYNRICSELDEGAAGTAGHVAMDVVGLFGDFALPGLGVAADAINALWYIIEGVTGGKIMDIVSGVLSIISMIPAIGDIVGKGTKAALWITRTFKQGEKGIKIIRDVAAWILRNKRTVMGAIETFKKGITESKFIEKVASVLSNSLIKKTPIGKTFSKYLNPEKLSEQLVGYVDKGIEKFMEWIASQIKVGGGTAERLKRIGKGAIKTGTQTGEEVAATGA